jgi:hypothetical protein
MADKVVLHIGLMKSGTTFIQRQLFAHQSTLRERGTLVPGARWGDQVTAVSDGLRRDGDHDGSWDALAAQIGKWRGTAIVSMEFLGPAGPRVLRRLIRSLAPARVEVVVTARDLNRSIAALWQETIQNGRSWTWPDYVAGVRQACPWHDPEEITEAGRTFWRQQDLSRIAGAWGKAADKVTVVTVPHPGAARGELLDRFTTAAGVEPLEIAPGGANESLGAASTLALRRMNQLLSEQGLDFPNGAELRKGYLAKKVLAARRPDEPAVGLPVQDWVVAMSEELVGRVRGLPLELVGDWTDLKPVDVPGTDPGEVDAEAVAEAAIAGLVGLVERQARK